MKKLLCLIILILNNNFLYSQVELKLVKNDGKRYDHVQILSFTQDSLQIKTKLYTIIHKTPNQSDNLETIYKSIKLSFDDISGLYVPASNKIVYTATIGGLIGLTSGVISASGSKEEHEEKTLLFTLAGAGIGTIFGMIGSFDTYYDINKMNRQEKTEFIKTLIQWKE